MINFETGPARKISFNKYLSQSPRTFWASCHFRAGWQLRALPFRELHTGLVPFAETTLFEPSQSGKIRALAPLLLTCLRPQIIILGVPQ
jgi:hypothetical protein